MGPLLCLMSHLMYVDDILLFSKAIPKSLKAIKNTMGTGYLLKFLRIND